MLLRKNAHSFANLHIAHVLSRFLSTNSQVSTNIAVPAIAVPAAAAASSEANEEYIRRPAAK